MYACCYVFSKPLIGSHAPEPVMAMLFPVGALCILPVFALFPTAWIRAVRGMLVALSMGLVATALACTLKTTSASAAATLGLAEPLGVALLGISVRRESLTLTGAAAMVLVLPGVLLPALPGRSSG